MNYKYFFLKAESWKMFLITTGVFIIGILLNKVDETYRLWSVVVLIAHIIIFIVGFSWTYIVGIFLHSKLPSTVKLSINYFRMNIFLFFLLYVSGPFMPKDPKDFPLWILIFTPVIFFYSMYACIYQIYFIAKALTSIEVKGNAKFGQFIEQFLLIFLFPIGIWYIQPRIRAIFLSDIGAG